jgi:hypothetical protein
MATWKRPKSSIRHLAHDSGAGHARALASERGERRDAVPRKSATSPSCRPPARIFHSLTCHTRSPCRGEERCRRGRLRGKQEGPKREDGFGPRLIVRFAGRLWGRRNPGPRYEGTGGIFPLLHPAAPGRAVDAATVDRGCRRSAGTDAWLHRAALLDKKLTGFALAEIRQRLRDFDRAQLPSVDHAQRMQRARSAAQDRTRVARGGAAA